MKEVNILLNTIEKATNFVHLSNLAPFDIDIQSGRYLMDAKSIMGLFSIDLRNPLKLRIVSDDNKAIDRYLESIKEYLA